MIIWSAHRHVEIRAHEYPFSSDVAEIFERGNASHVISERRDR